MQAPIPENGQNHRHHAHDGHEACACGHEHHEHHEHEGCACGHEHHEHHEHEGCSCGHAHYEHHEHHEHHAQHTHVHESRVRGGVRVYRLENLGCANCAARMEERIRALPGVDSASIVFATKQLRLHARKPEALLPEIQRICASIESNVRVIAPEEGHAQERAGHAGSGRKRELAQLLLGAALFIASLLLEHGGAAELLVLAVSAAGYLLLGTGVLLEALRGMRRGGLFNENFLMSIATLGAFAIRNYPEAMGIMLFYRVGEFFEHMAVERSRSQIMEAVDMRPEVVNLLRGDEIHTVAAGEARPGDLLLIRPGDRIPLDGTIIEGESRLDSSPITGEPVPVRVGRGDSATSGCINGSGQLVLRVEKPLEESMVSRILNSVENAAASKPKIDRFITRFSRVYTPCVVGMALATALLPPIFDGRWSHWIYTAITFLVMSCPCALVLSVPLAFFSGIGAGSRRGILFKGGAAIEAMADLRAVVMDKTGTLTRGDFRLQRVLSLGGMDEAALLRLCAGCEQHSSHPIAHSIVSAARERGLSIDSPSSLEEIAGMGVEAALGGRRLLCGNRKLMESRGVAVDAAIPGSFGAEVYLAVDGRLEGMLLISDTIKPDAREAVERLKRMGLHTAMLTGDSEGSARAVAGETGVEELHARLLPHEKLEALAGIRSRRGAVMFVGDGINDAPVLAGADVGAAMGSGADAAIEAADAVFMTGSARSIPEAVDIARGTRRIALQNVIFALAIKLAVMVLGLCGFANMWLAVFADTGVAMLCVLNSIRALYRAKDGG